MVWYGRKCDKIHLTDRCEHVKDTDIVCLKSKYGFCKYGRNCDKINLTDICENVKDCSGYQCDKRHPIACYYFKKYNMCKLNFFCSYMHHTDIVHSEENKLQIEVKKLKDEVANLQIKVSLMGKILDSIKTQSVHDNTIIPETYESENILLNPDKVSPNNGVTFETLIRENSWFFF